MREPRPGCWSARRAARRAAYQDWMESPAWQAARARWHATWVTVFGAEPACLACGASWTLRDGDLHHRDYARLGNEHFTDLVPLCRLCYDQVHQIFDAIPGWRRAGRVAATDAIITRLRKARACQEGRSR